jgi:hypothetical protein
VPGALDLKKQNSGLGTRLEDPPSRKEREKGRAPAYCVLKAWASP